MLKILLLVFSAALLRAFALPGWFDFALPFLVFPAIMLRIELLSRRYAWRYEYLCGVVFWLFAFSFLSNVNPFAPFGAALIMGSTFVVEAWVFRKLNYSLSAATSACLALPACEFVRMKWFYLAVGGVPWASFGFPLADTSLLPLASSIGESGLVIVAVCLSAAFYCLLRKQASTPLLLSAVVMLLAVATISPAPKPTSVLDCLVIQPSIGVHQKNDQMYAEEFFEIQYDLSKSAMQAHPQFDLMLWAETMWPLPAVDEGQHGELRRPWPGEDDEVLDLERMARMQRETVAFVMSAAPDDSYFLTGSHFYHAARPAEHSDRSTDFILFSKEGDLLQHFSKSMLVPFGEILPFNNKFPGSVYLCDLAQEFFGLRPDFIISEDAGPLIARDNLPALGGAVCWENVFEQPFRSQSAAGAAAFAILSNEDWLGADGLEMTQMVSASKLRAAETGRALLRATNTGLSCVVSPNGSVDIGPGIRERAFWLAKLPLISPQFQTSYLKSGWLLAPVWAIICLIMLVLNILGKRRLDLSSENK